MDNADLERLKVTPGRLVPKFQAKVTEYNVTVASNVSETKLTTLTSDGGASCMIKGDATSKTVQLTEGVTSTVRVVVTAEDGTSTKTYTIAIHRLSSNDACLSQLELSAGTLQPSFSPATLTYYCDLPSNLTSLSLKTKTEDAGMKTNLANGSAVGTITLSPGLTVIEIMVTSVNGAITITYTINAIRLQCPYNVTLASNEATLKYTCTACAGVLHCPCNVKGTHLPYCQKCILELSRINKADPLSGVVLGEGWLIINQSLDAELSTQLASCLTPHGKVEGNVGEIPALVAKQKKAELAFDSCADCSKKVPIGLLESHKGFSCSSKLSEALSKTEVTVPSWQKRYIDVSLPNDFDAVLKKASELETQYKELLSQSNSADIREVLSKVASCYATAINIKPKDTRGHIGLGLVMEELFHVEDSYGHKPIVSDESEDNEAETSSKEEEFMAICELHGVSQTASLILQLKAVEVEYHSLKEAGQGHRSEHVQALYQWKSKKALQASKGSYAVESESPLFKAKVKFEHSVRTNSTDHTACYHLGRISLLLGENEEALIHLKVAASIKPTHSETLLCLGLALSGNEGHAKFLLAHGLSVYLQQREDEAEGSLNNSAILHGVNFWRPTNTLIGESLLKLSRLGGHEYLSQRSCLILIGRLFSSTPGLQKGSTVKQLLWLLLRARAGLLEISLKDKSSQTSLLCQQISSLISHCQLPPTEQLRELQMKVFENGVVLQPSNTLALCHLGNGQLQQFEATSDNEWLSLAEKSFRAALACEGKDMNCKDPPTLISEQEWWKKRTAVSMETKKPVDQQAKPVASKAGPTAAKQPQAVGRTPSKPSVQPVARGRQPVKPVAGGAKGRGTAPAISKGQPVGTAGRGKSVATLGELKGGQKQGVKPVLAKAAEKVPDKEPEPKPVETAANILPAQLNDITYLPRLGLARSLTKQNDKVPKGECIDLYQEVIKMAGHIHDAYIELGELLAKTAPLKAVDVYAQFPFTNPPSFDDAYLHGEIVRIIMKEGCYDDPRLAVSMIAMGRALGIGVLDRNVSMLESKFKTALLREVYAGIHEKKVDDPDLMTFFKFKCWT